MPTTTTPYERIVLGAFKLAVREHGIPDHHDGKCPEPGCTCVALGDSVEARATELLSNLDSDDAGLCEDCGVLLEYTCHCDDCWLAAGNQVTCQWCHRANGCIDCAGKLAAFGL